MLRQALRPHASREKSQGQALVEFSLTLMVFLLLMVMIVEVGRILWTYVTLQHAARVGARYAVTGQWEEQYAANPRGHWDPTSGDPMAHIPPCWPRFHDESAIDPSLTSEADTPIGYDAYEPYRNPRTCSVEAAALNAMAVLPLNPLAGEGNPGYYRVRVSGVSEDKYPTTGTFTRGNPAVSYNYASYFTLPSHAGNNFGWSPGFAGRPEQPVAVRVEHRLPVITPLLQGIAPSIMLQGTAIMTNEAYGSTGVQRQAILPPDLPNTSPFEVLLPPDLTIDSITFNGNPLLVEPNDPGSARFTVNFLNVGDIQAAPDFVINLYAVPAGGSPGALPWSGPVGSSGPISPLMPDVSGSVTIEANFPAVGRYEVYAWVDATEVVDEIGTGEETNPAGEDNNTIQYGSVILVGDLVDLSVTKSVDNNTPNAGSQINYTLNYANTGLSDAIGVTITDVFDTAGLTYTGPDCTQSGQTITCSLGTVTAGASGTVVLPVDIDNDPALVGQLVHNRAEITSSGGETEMDPGNNVAELDIAVEGVDVRVEATVDEDEPNSGDTVTFTVTVRNFSTNAASAVQVETDFPTGIDVTGSTPSVGTYSGNIWSLGGLAGGASATLTITADVTATTGSPQVSFELQPTSPTNVNNDLLRTITLDIQNADLQVSKQVTPSLVAVSEDVTYTLRVTNNGPDDATSVALSDPLPTGLTFVSASGDGSAAYDAASRTVNWDIGNLADGASATLTLTATLTDGNEGDEVTNTVASLTADQHDTITSNNLPSATFEVGNKADLAISGSVTGNGGTSGTSAIATVGQDIRYTLSVTNNGPNDATGVVVTGAVRAQLLSALTNITVSDPDGLDTSTGTWTIGDLAAGATRTLTIDATVADRSTRTSYTTTARVNLTEPTDLYTDNNSIALTVTLTDTLVDLSISVTPPSISAPFNSPVEYTVTVSNAGPDAANNLQLSLVAFVNLGVNQVLSELSFAPDTGTFDAASGRWTIPTLASGSSTELTVTGRVTDMNAQSEPRTYNGNVTIIAVDEWDPTPASAQWVLETTWIAPAYYNIGSSTVTWGAWDGTPEGLANGHPRIGENVQWVPFPGTVGASLRTPDSRVTVYAPSSSSYPSGQGVALAAGSPGDTLFQELANANQAFNVSLNGLVPGSYEVTLLMFEPSKKEIFTISANGVTLFNGTDWRTANAPVQVYYVTQPATVTVASNGNLTIAVEAKGSISGVALEFLGP